MNIAPSSLTKIITGVFPTGFGKITTIIFGFLCVLLYTRCLSKEEYGILILFQVMLGFAATFSDFGTDITVTKFITSTENENEKASIINTIFIFRFITLCFIAIIGLLIKRFVIHIALTISPLITKEIFMIFLILIIVEGMNLLFFSSLVGLYKFTFFGIVESLMSLTSFMITYVLIVWHQQGVMGAIYARLASRSLVLILSAIWMRKIFKFQFKWNSLNNMLHFSTPLYLNQVLSLAFTRLDTIIISSLLGAAQTAIYEIGRIIPDSLDQLFEAFRQVYFSILSDRFARNDMEEVNYLLNHSIRLIAFISLLAAFFVLLFGGDIVRLIFSVKYGPSVPVFILLMVLFSFKMITYILGYSLTAVGESNKPPIVNFFRALVLFPSYYITIPLLGITGAAITNILGTFVANPLNLYFLRKKGIVVRFMNYLKPVAIYFIFFSILYLLPLYNLWVKITIFVSYLLVNLIFSVFTRKDAFIIYRELISMAKKR